MQPLHEDNFEIGTAVLNTTLYPSIFGAASAGAVSGVVTFNGSASAGHSLGYDLTASNYTVEAEVAVDASDDRTGAVILMARYNKAANGEHYGFAACFRSCAYPKADGTDSGVSMTAGNLYLVKSTGTTATTTLTGGLVSAVASGMVAGTTYRMRIVVNGNLIEGYINDVQKITGTDTEYPVPYRPAFGWKRLGTAAGTILATLDRLRVNPFSTYANMQAAFDQPADIIKFSIPVAGSLSMQQLFCYCRSTGDWTVEDLATSCLGTWKNINGERQILYGKASDGLIYEFDDTATRDGSAFTGTWRSNWIKLDGTLERKVVLERIQFLVGLLEVNSMEVSVEVADDPDDPTTIVSTGPISGFDANIPMHIGQRGNFFRVSITHSASTGSLKLREIKVEALQ